MVAEQRANRELETDVEDRLASMVRSAKAEARTAAMRRPNWTPREWSAAANKPAPELEAAPLDLARVRNQLRPAVTYHPAPTARPNRWVLVAPIVLFLVALTIAILAAVGVL